MAGSDDDPDFEALMQGMGVRPVPAGPARAGEVRVRPRGSDDGRPKGKAPAPAIVASPPRDAVAPGVRRELEEALATLALLRDELAAAREAQGRAQDEASRAAAGRAALEQRIGDIEAARDAALHDAQAAARERKAVQQQLAEAQQRLREATRSGVTLRARFAERGIERLDELELVQQEWLDRGRLGAWLDAIDASEDEAVPRFLEEQISLLCGDPGCPPRAGAAVLTVAPERCDVCEGSDTRRALESFVDRCTELGIRRVRLVGGSPNYHTQLRKLTDGDPRIELKLIPGDGRRNQTDAKADQKHSELVIIWGGTILDHSTSQNYDPALGRFLVVAHRGIAGMLRRATEALGEREVPCKSQV